tara:strand:+ start:562 stop:1041 length:480 start_codon:yes stop_codon:yes gene_type:complete
MGIRRQVIEFSYGDDGSQPVEDLEEFPEKQQSIISSGFGNATEPSAATKVNQFITVEAMGSTPGLWATETNWCPVGYMQIQVENTFFYNLPDGRMSDGLSGTAAPYPISVQYQRSYNSFPRVYLSQGTSFDVLYYMVESFIGTPDNFSGLPMEYNTVNY